MTTDRTLQVYLIRLGDTDYFKVGMTSDINGRLASLQTATPFALHLITVAQHDNAYTVERDMHEALKSCHVRNEWFQCDQEYIVRVFAAMSAMAVIDQGLDIPELEQEQPPADEVPVAKDKVIAFMLRQGCSYRQIERDMGVSHQTISQVSRLLRSSQAETPVLDESMLLATA